MIVTAQIISSLWNKRSGENMAAFCYIIFILKKAQPVVLFKRFVNFTVSQGMYLPEEKRIKTCYLPQCFGSEDGKNCELWKSRTLQP